MINVGINLIAPLVKLKGFCFVKHPSNPKKEILVGLFQQELIWKAGRPIFYITKEEMNAPGDRILIAYTLDEYMPLSFIKPLIDKKLSQATFTKIKRLLRESFSNAVWHFVKN